MPRGALFTETLDLLDRLGIDTREVRENDRKLLFEQAGIVTMRPVGRPDLRRGGRRRPRDHRQGRADGAVRARGVRARRPRLRATARWCWPRWPGRTAAAEALRRLGVVRIATKYPRIAARHFLETGRQAEIVEVKGSVELAPLTGLVEGIVDLTATGTTLRENGLVVREEIARLHRAADRQSGRPQAQGDARSTRCWSGSMRSERLTIDGRPARPGRGAARARARAGIGPRRRSPRSSPAVRADGDDASCAYTRRSTPAAPPSRRCGSRAPSSTPPLDALDHAVRAGLERAIENVRRVAEAAAGPRRARSSSTATKWSCARRRSSVPACTCPAAGRHIRARS